MGRWGRGRVGGIERGLFRDLGGSSSFSCVVVVVDGGGGGGHWVSVLGSGCGFPSRLSVLLAQNAPFPDTSVLVASRRVTHKGPQALEKKR